MFDLKIGVGQVSLRMRYAQSLKEKRKVLQSLTQKLRNLGFSVTQSGYQEHPKQGSLGFTFAGSTHAQVEQALDEMERLLIGEFEVLEVNREVVDYSELGQEEFEWEPEDEFEKQ